MDTCFRHYRTFWSDQTGSQQAALLPAFFRFPASDRVLTADNHQLRHHQSITITITSTNHSTAGNVEKANSKHTSAYVIVLFYDATQQSR
ncbi:hypothetical protein L1887_33321 [Cichorium endivia]|nr:hypothetical protein L1887_33321 [Cichorium endivia]